jgi:hypothetical protein
MKLRLPFVSRTTHARVVHELEELKARQHVHCRVKDCAKPYRSDAARNRHEWNEHQLG